ncbi:hypothetical protein ACIBG8_42845 [Nonomuraea sp. NPDC050556]|uniref:hypothetical protein n=1 Tax=Nonomuraea sp. NPDC050556 TaxID=3364369 RepID=UPI0037A8E05C
MRLDDPAPLVVESTSAGLGGFGRDPERGGGGQDHAPHALLGQLGNQPPLLIVHLPAVCSEVTQRAHPAAAVQQQVLRNVQVSQVQVRVDSSPAQGVRERRGAHARQRRRRSQWG